MLIEAARQAEAAAKEMLACINSGSASCPELREALAITKSFMAAGSAFQVRAAQVIAKSERHGDGGTQVLADTAGMSRQAALGQVKTARVIEAVPAVRDAVETGRVAQANAKRLAEAIERTSAEAVQSDGELLDKAQTMRPEQFAKEARRWAVEREGDGGASEHARQRARRCVRMWDSDDGMVRLHGEFDSVTGRRIRNRLRAEARRMLDADREADRENANKASKNASTNGSGHQRRSFDQCMADALDNLTAGAGSGGGEPFADICVVAHVDEATGELIAELPDGERLPRSVLEQLACNARFTGVIYDRKGRAIWRAHPVRRATKAQRQLLIARDGGCFACGADPGICDVHHVEPVSQGGPTSLDNLVLACWQHHTAVHHFGWQIHGPPGNRTLHPPDTVNYGPAHAPDSPRMFGPETTHAPDSPRMFGPERTHAPDSQPVFGHKTTRAPDSPRVYGHKTTRAPEQPVLVSADDEPEPVPPSQPGLLFAPA